MVEHIGAREARSDFTDLMGRVHYGGQTVIIKRSRKPMVAVIPIDVYQRLIAEREALFQALDCIRARLPEVVQEQVEQDALLVPGTASAAGSIPEDPSDEMVLACAVDGGTDLIVNGDRHLLDLGEHQGIPILTVREFVAGVGEERAM